MLQDIQFVAILHKSFLFLSYPLVHKVINHDIQCFFFRLLSPSKKQVQRFLGTLNYQSDFIPGFAKICEPLLEYVRTDTKFKLSTEAMSAFEKLKQICSNETLLYFIDSKLPVFLDVDASQTAYGGLLI